MSDTLGSWVSNTTLADIGKTLAGAKSVAVTTHVKPDGDAVGSSIALVRALIRHGAKAQAVYFGPKPGWFKQIVKDTPYVDLDAQPAPSIEPDVVVVIDTGSWVQIEPIASWLKTRGEKTIVVDHHKHGDASVSRLRHIDVSAAAVCQSSAELCRVILGVAKVGQLPVEIAEPLYLGLATDTGWFRHSNVTPAVMRLAGDLIEAGVDHNALYQTVEQQDTPARLRLVQRALASLELFDGDRIAIMSLTRRDFSETGAASADSGGLVDLPQSVASVRAIAVLTEADPGEYGKTSNAVLTKISLRSKHGADAIDVNAVAQTLGGGGHTRAAGAKMALPLVDTKAKVLAALRGAK